MEVYLVDHHPIDFAVLKSGIGTARGDNDWGESVVTLQLNPADVASVSGDANTGPGGTSFVDDVSHVVNLLASRAEEVATSSSSVQQAEGAVGGGSSGIRSKCLSLYMRNSTSMKSTMTMNLRGELLHYLQQYFGNDLRVRVEIEEAKVKEHRSTVPPGFPYYHMPGEELRNFMYGGVGPQEVRRGRVLNMQQEELRRRAARQELIQARIYRVSFQHQPVPPHQPPRHGRGEEFVVVHLDDDRNTSSRDLEVRPQKETNDAWIEGFMRFPSRWDQLWLARSYMGESEATLVKTYRFHAKVSVIVSQVEGWMLRKDPMVVVKKMLLEEIGTDTTIVTKDGGLVKCHKSFLSANSKVFKAALEGDFKGAKESTLDLKDMREDCVRALLGFLYYWDLDKPKSDLNLAIELLEAAHKYDIVSLENAMKRILLDKPIWAFDVEQALELFFVGVSIGNMEELKLKSAMVLKSKSQEMQSSEAYKRLFSGNPNAAMELCNAFASMK